MRAPPPLSAPLQLELASCQVVPPFNRVDVLFASICVAQPVDNGNEAARIGGVAGPHLRAHRPAVAIEQHREDHLIEIRPMVLGKASLSDGLAARPLKIEAGRVQEHEIERAEQIAPPREQFLLDDVL